VAQVDKVEEMDAPSHFCATACTLESINDFISTIRRQRLPVASTPCIALTLSVQLSDGGAAAAATLLTPH
jgi:hypothetical protein